MDMASINLSPFSVFSAAFMARLPVRYAPDGPTNDAGRADDTASTETLAAHALARIDEVEKFLAGGPDVRARHCLHHPDLAALRQKILPPHGLPSSLAHRREIAFALALLNRYCALLKDERLDYDARLESARQLASEATLCLSASIMHVQNAVGELDNLLHGVHGEAVSATRQLVERFIEDFVHTRMTDFSGTDAPSHLPYLNALCRTVGEAYGLPWRDDFPLAALDRKLTAQCRLHIAQSFNCGRFLENVALRCRQFVQAFARSQWRVSPLQLFSANQIPAGGLHLLEQSVGRRFGNIQGTALIERVGGDAGGARCGVTQDHLSLIEPLFSNLVRAKVLDESVVQSVARLHDQVGQYEVRWIDNLCWGRRLRPDGGWQGFALEPSHVVDLYKYLIEECSAQFDSAVFDIRVFVRHAPRSNDGSSPQPLDRSPSLQAARERMLHPIVRQVRETATDRVPAGSTMLMRIVPLDHLPLVDVVLALWGEETAKAVRADGETALSLAVKAGVGTKVIARLAHAGADFGWVDGVGMNLSAWAYFNDRRHLVNILERHGATLRGRAHETLMELAFANRKSRLLQRLFRDRMVPPAYLHPESGTASPLHRAVQGDMPGLVRMLIMQWQPLDQCDDHGLTPLMVAVAMNAERSMALLLAAGAGDSMVSRSALRGWLSANPGAPAQARSIVERFIEDKRHAEMSLLLRPGRQPAWGAPNTDEGTPTSHGARSVTASEVLATVRHDGGDFHLIRRGDVFWGERDGKVFKLTLPHLGAIYRHARRFCAPARDPLVLKIARDALGWLVHAPVDGGHLLMEAAVRDHAGVAKLVIEQDGIGQAYLRRADGHSALSLAVWADSVDVVTALIGANANLKWRDRGDLMSLQALAAYRGHTLIRQRLEQAGARLVTGDYLAMMQQGIDEGNAAFLVEFFTTLPDADIKLNDSLIAEFAARPGMEEVVECLLRRGLKADALRSDGRTALAVAAERDLHRAVQVLLDAGGDPDLADRTGNTALSRARKNHARLSLIAIEAAAKAKRAEAARRQSAPAQPR